MYNNKSNYSLSRRYPYFAVNTNEAFQNRMNAINSEYKVGNFFILESVTEWCETYYNVDVPKNWAAMFIAQIVQYTPAAGYYNFFTGKKRVTSLPRLVVKAPDGRVFEPVVFEDTGEEIMAYATVLTEKYLEESACYEGLRNEEFWCCAGSNCIGGLSRNDAMNRFSSFEVQKDEMAERLKSEYEAYKIKNAREQELRRQQYEEQRQREEKGAESRRRFNEFFG